MIAILLCTYNGSLFLNAQLQSLMNQTCKNFTIFLHDDGSMDDTMDIVRKFQLQYPGKLEVMDDSMTHRGAGSSFMWLLENVEADYYMFCDQDDYWLPTKVEHTLGRMKEIESVHAGMPILIHTDLKLADVNLNVTNDSFWRYQNFIVDVSKRKEYICFGNIVTGCTVIINNLVKNIAFPYDGSILHDYWLALKVAQYGVVDNLKESTILYRQHGHNEAGAGEPYNRKRINFNQFIKGIGKECGWYKNVLGYGVFSWFIHRALYFVYRHIK